MWILPRQLHTLASVQDTQALILDSQELSTISAQSLTVRSKHLLAQTWLRKWKKAFWTSHLSGRILKPSLGSSFAEQWTSSLEASLVSHSALQDDAPETMTQDTFGHTSSEASNSLDDLPLFSLRTSKASSPQSSVETIGATPQERPFCSMSSESWSAWVTKQRQAYLVRVKSAHRIKEKDFLFLQRIYHQKILSLLTFFCKNQIASLHIPFQKIFHNIILSLQEQLLQNPEIQLSLDKINLGLLEMESSQIQFQGLFIHFGKNSFLKYPPYRFWQTPTARDYKGLSSKLKLSKTTSHLLPDQVYLLGHSGFLNPRWLEMLMGIPPGWVTPSLSN